VDFPFGCVVAVYTLAAAYDGHPQPVRRLGALGAAAAFVPTTAAIYVAGGHDSAGALTGILFWALAFAGAWLAGALSRLRHARVAELERRAVRAERETRRERRLAAAEERLRIARELHDSAAHAINTILLQAGAARLLHERDPVRSRQAIVTVEQVARDTIGEIDRLVHALREDPGEREPVPADPALIEELLDRHRADGLRLASRLDGTRARLPRSVAWAAYRIVQEALTNAARHGAGSADVTVSFRPEAVEIEVTNPTGRAAGDATRGHGIIGMRERAALLGGTLEAAAEHGTFRLHAVLPYDHARA
jgi:signal transduction histidine kinase